MPRIRTIKPEFHANEKLSRCPESTHLLAAALLNYADDDGYFNANVHLIKAACFPLREPSVSIHDSLSALQFIGFLRLGVTVDTRSYGHIVNFLEHQRINRPTKSVIKNIEIKWLPSPTTHALLTEPSQPEGKGKEGKGKEMEEAPISDIRTILFQHCADWLAFNNGHDRKPYRAQIGKWLKIHSEADLISAFTAAQKANPQGDRVSYIHAVLKPKKKTGQVGV